MWAFFHERNGSKHIFILLNCLVYFVNFAIVDVASVAVIIVKVTVIILLLLCIINYIIQYLTFNGLKLHCREKTAVWVFAVCSLASPAYLATAASTLALQDRTLASSTGQLDAHFERCHHS